MEKYSSTKSPQKRRNHTQTSTTRGRKRARWVAIFLALLMTILLASPLYAASSILVSHGSTTTKKIALTFDFGSDAGGLSSILQTSATYKVKSTFFMTGESAASNPAAAKTILAGGHEIGNHSYSHPDFTTITSTQMVDQLRRTENVLVSQTGQKPKPYFRPPYGAYNSTVLQTVENAGYTHTILWNIDTIDWQNPSTATIISRVLDNARNGAIVLMHVSGTINTRYALPDIIEGLKSRGYSLVTISELLGTAGSYTTYTVKSGDTLYKIASLYNVTVASIVAANSIVNPNLIYVGQVLKIPTTAPVPPPPPPPPPPTGVVYYTVKSGDTLYKIASLYNVTVTSIVTANSIVNPNLIYVGQVLKIP
ncbi:MAG: LysM peptidoglycan-binding domain-containing protein [Clostridia bacterium]|nr:LysM peptidoglycan-binding domain-containing protein [Clostridia bacterium]